MERTGRRILLAIEPTVLEGALATMLSAAYGDDITQLGRGGTTAGIVGYDAAVVSDALPHGVEAGVVIVLPDTRGSGGTGTVTRGDVVHEVSIDGAEGVVELLDEYVPHQQLPVV
jgi:hypothetical protein